MITTTLRKLKLHKSKFLIFDSSSVPRCSLNLSLLLTEPTENGYSTLTFSLAQTGLQELLDSAQQQSLELCTECFNEYIDGCGPSCQTDLESVAADLEPIFSFFVSSVKDPLRYLVIKTYLKTISPAKPVPIQLIQVFICSHSSTEYTIFGSVAVFYFTLTQFPKQISNFASFRGSFHVLIYLNYHHDNS